MTLDRKAVRKIAIHVAIWVFYIIYESSLYIVIYGRWMNFWQTLVSFVLNALVFYISSLIILPRFIIGKKYIYLVINILLLIAGYLVGRYVLKLFVMPYLGDTTPVSFVQDKVFWAESVWRGCYFIILSFAYWFALASIRSEQKRRILEEHRRKREQKLRITEKNLMEAEYAFLKTQINPHFLFNALNFFYAQVYPHSENAAKGILLLSDIMRYALKEDDSSGKVMLEKEVQHLRNYVDINQLRFNNNLKIVFEVIGNMHFRMITPLVLITFVENCFKHGELFDPQNPLKIRLEVTNDQLFFYTWNKKRNGPKEKSTGIGLANTKKRLDIMYKDQYSLKVEDESDSFACHLTLNL